MKWRLSSTYGALAGSPRFQKGGKTGSIAFNIEGDDAYVGPLREATPLNGQMRFVLARANIDPQAGAYGAFIIEPYTYGMSMSYGGIVQVNTACLAVGPMWQATGVDGVLGPLDKGGIILAINETDLGGLFLTAANGVNPPLTAYSRLISEAYDRSDMGPMQFVTRGASGFEWWTGPPSAEVTTMTLTSTGALKVKGPLTIGSNTGAVITALGGLGTAPPAPTILGDASHGVASFGTGSGAASGGLVVVTLPTSYINPPNVQLTVKGFAGSNIPYYVDTVTVNEFVIGCSGPIGSSVAAGTYRVSYSVTG